MVKKDVVVFEVDIIIVRECRGLSKRFLNVNRRLLSVMCFFPSMQLRVWAWQQSRRRAGRQIGISSDSSLGFVLPAAVKDSLGLEMKPTLIFLAWLCDGWGTCLWSLTLTKIFPCCKHGHTDSHGCVCVNTHVGFRKDGSGKAKGLKGWLNPPVKII